MKKFIFTLLILVSFGYSNYIRISGGERLPDPNRDLITFTISWDNSWRVGGAPGNHDAAWVFVKFRPCEGGNWVHGLLSTTMADHAIGSDLEAAEPVLLEDRFGVVPGGATETNHLGHNNGIMLRRSTFGTGHVVSVVCTLKVVNTVAEFDPTVEYTVRVFGVEMVRVNEGSFVLGDGNVGSSVFNMTVIDGSNYNQTVTAATLGGNYQWVTHARFTTTADLPPAYPKGYEKFYCMKYEISQGMFADFMNTVDGYNGGPQQFYGVNRNNLIVNAGATSSTPNLAQNFMSWYDLLAYLDWAALRPMTELEFEKACRGNGGAVANEYAWGSNVYTKGWVFDVNPDGTEICLTAGANINIVYSGNGSDGGNRLFQQDGNYPAPLTEMSYIDGGSSGSNSPLTSYWSPNIPDPTLAINDPNAFVAKTTPGYNFLTPLMGVFTYDTQLNWAGYGPVGCGVFARDSTLSRHETGATYWGIMEMSGNVWEQCIGVTNSGSAYTGEWGDGYLGGGTGNEPGWNLITRACRGGAYGYNWPEARVSNRFFANVQQPAVRDLTENDLGSSHVYRSGSGNRDWTSNSNGTQRNFRRGSLGGRGVR